jgi:hypothetical protein
MMTELERLARAATPGPWEVDTVRNDGEYGDGGPDSHVGFDSFAIFDQGGRALFDSLNRDGALTQVDEEADYEDGYHRAWDRLAEADARYLAACSPDVVLKLLEVCKAAPYAADVIEVALRYIPQKTSDSKHAAEALAALRSALAAIGETKPCL